MEIAESYLHGVLQISFEKAIGQDDKCDKEQVKHANRARNWVECLAQEFRTLFSDDSVRVFSRHNDSNKNAFGLNEFMYDVHVCRVGKTVGVVSKKELSYVKEAIWQIESELEGDTGEIVKDFSKLIIGAAENKLFVAAHSKMSEGILHSLIPLAQDCPGNVYVAFIPHPREWTQGMGYVPRLYRFTDGSWVKIDPAPGDSA